MCLIRLHMYLSCLYMYLRLRVDSESITLKMSKPDLESAPDFSVSLNALRSVATLRCRQREAESAFRKEYGLRCAVLVGVEREATSSLSSHSLSTQRAEGVADTHAKWVHGDRFRAESLHSGSGNIFNSNECGLANGTLALLKFEWGPSKPSFNSYAE